MFDKKIIYGASMVGTEAGEEFRIDEHDYVPHFQRVSISGEDTSGVSLQVCQLLGNPMLFLPNLP